MMPKVVADTNVFLRFLLHDIPNQYVDAERLFNQAREKKISLIIPQIVIFEIAYTLEKFYKLPKEQVIDKIKSLLSAEYFKIQDQILIQQAIDSYEVGNLSLVDYFILHFSETESAELVTFDKNLAKLAGRAS